jgi:hypothetical protein
LTNKKANIGLSRNEFWSETKANLVYWKASFGNGATVVKNKAKRNKFEDKEDLATQITEACNSVPPNHLHAFVQHSVNLFEKCLNEEHI